MNALPHLLVSVAVWMMLLDLVCIRATTKMFQFTVNSLTDVRLDPGAHRMRGGQSVTVLFCALSIWRPRFVALAEVLAAAADPAVAPAPPLSPALTREAGPTR